MVQSQSPRLPPRVAVLAICLVLLAPATLPQTVAQGDQLGIEDNFFVLRVTQGEAKFFDQNGKRAWFLDNRSTATLEVIVYNNGTRPAQDVPVYFWFSDTEVDSNLANLPRGCVRITVPERQFNATLGYSIPSNVTAKFNFPVPVNYPARGYNITARVNQPPDLPMSAFDSACQQNHGNIPGRTIDPGDASNNYANHTLRAYFVKELKPDFVVQTSATSSGIRWCGSPAAPVGDSCNEGMEDAVYPYIYNRTVHTRRPDPDNQGQFIENTNVQNSWLQVNVANVGTWQDITDYGGPCGCDEDRIPYAVRVLASGYNMSATTDITWAGAAPNGTGWQTVGRLALRDRAGDYHLNVTIDPLNQHREASPTAGVNAEGNNGGYRWIHVRYVDFATSINATDFAHNASVAYEYLTEFPIHGNVTLRNLGTAPLLHPESSSADPLLAQAKVSWRIHIEGTNFTHEGTIDRSWDQDPSTPEIDFTEAVIHVNNWTATSLCCLSNYIRPGKHTLVAEFDVGNRSYEPNERNNRHEMEIFVQDSTKPVIVSGPTLTAEDGETLISKVYPRDPFAVKARVTDDDESESLSVKVNFTLKGNSSVYRVYPLKFQRSTESNFSGSVANFTFHGSNGTTQDWLYTLEVRDAFNNVATTGNAPKTLRVEKHLIHTIPEVSTTGPHLVRNDSAPDGVKLPYAETTSVTYYVQILEPWTKVFNQSNVTHNLFMFVQPPKSDWVNTTQGWRKLTACTDSPAGVTNKETVDGLTIVCNPGDPENMHHFRATVSRATGEPGLWNVSMQIMDVAGDVRYINRSFIFVDSAPVPVSREVLNSNWTNITSLDAGQTLWVTANFTDDRPTPLTAVANFTRSDGKVVSVNLTGLPGVAVPNSTDSNRIDHYYFRFNTSIPTGRGKELGLGGDFNVTIAAVDATGNWVNAPYLLFKVNDTLPPRLLEAKVNPAVQEINQDVTFTARGFDETDMKLSITIFSGDQEVSSVTLDPSDAGGQNFTWTTSIGVEGNYRWQMVLRDSMDRPVEHDGTLAIRKNLGPRFEILSPSTLVGGVRFGQAAPRIEVLAFDSDTVDTSSIVMVVDGQPVVPELGPAPPGVTGVTLAYQVPAGRKFEHGQDVWVNVTASDGSDKHLEESLNFTFRVDDVAPSTRVVSFEPRHREGANHVWNISLATRFELRAEDQDGLPTDVAAIRYRILAGGVNSGENLYTGPFRINDAPGVYRGPLVYYVHAWAEDAVGNVNKTPVILTVFVDDAPPELIQYFPQGRFVNATFVDDRVGVERAVVWHRINAEPYRALELEQDAANVWKGTLPEAAKGNRVSYYLQAWDRLGNTQTFGNASEPRASFAATNHDPMIQIKSPVTGSRVANTFDLTWEADDVDGDALVFTVMVRYPGRTGYVELAKLEQSETRRYPVDTRRFQDGEYAFRVSASDAGVVKHSEVVLNIINRADAIVGVTPITGRVDAGSTVLLKAEIAKAEAVVEARLYLKDELVGSYPMNDEGRDGDEVANDGVYSVRAPVDRFGDYSVEIFTRYQENGELRSSSLKDAVTFSASMTPGYVLREYTLVLALIALAAVAAIGLSAWLLMRKRG